MYKIVEDVDAGNSVVIDSIQNVEECRQWGGNKFNFDTLRNKYNSYLKQEKKEKCLAFVSTRTGQAIGQLVLGEITPGDFATIKFVLVRKEFRGSGIGEKFLFDACMYAFSVFNIKLLRLRVRCDNVSAIKCYKKVGFMQFGDSIFGSVRMFMTYSGFKERNPSEKNFQDMIRLGTMLDIARNRVLFADRNIEYFDYKIHANSICIKEELIKVIENSVRKVRTDAVFSVEINGSVFSCAFKKEEGSKSIRDGIDLMLRRDVFFLEGQFTNHFVVKVYTSLKLINVSAPVKLNELSEEQVTEKDNISIKIEEAMKEVLNQKQIGKCADFFLEGGNSLLAMKFVLLLEREGIALDMEDVFKLRTLAKLTEKCKKKLNS